MKYENDFKLKVLTYLIFDNQYNPGISRNNEGIKKYFAISEALTLETFDDIVGEYTISNAWRCDFDSMVSDPCPAGSYCLPAGIDTTAPNKITCPAYKTNNKFYMQLKFSCI